MTNPSQEIEVNFTDVVRSCYCVLFVIHINEFEMGFRCNEVEKYGVYPWIHQLENHLTSEHQTQIVRFPDVNPYTLLRPNKSQFTMAAGDFLEVITIVRSVAS